jgi:predicted metal-dependent phosphoesterase TrpH
MEKTMNVHGLRCDLHVHSRYSGPIDLPVLRHVGRESYSEPDEVYDTAKARGMELVTLTDHDTVEGAIQLAHHEDFIVGEEVTAMLDDDREFHLGVWGIDEWDHEEIARRRFDLESLLAFLAERRIPAALNHPFSPLTGRRVATDFERVLGHVSLVEELNGSLPTSTNAFATDSIRGSDAHAIGGSDSHTLRGIGRAYTFVPGACTREDYLDGLRAGATVPVGTSGTYAGLVADIMTVVKGAARENLSGVRDGASLLRSVATLCLLPFVPIAPLFGLASRVHELRGSRAIHLAWREATLVSEGCVPPTQQRAPGLVAADAR